MLAAAIRSPGPLALGVAVEALIVVVLALAVLMAVIFVVSAPLRTVRRPPGMGGGRIDGVRGGSINQSSADRADLEATREAKYREIRDTELDYRTGKLSQEDYAAVDGTLRAEAVEILDRLQALDGGEPC